MSQVKNLVLQLRDRIGLIDARELAPAVEAVAPLPAATPRKGLIVRNLRNIRVGRILRGGWIADKGRLPRYALLFTLGFVAVWAPIGVYLKVAPYRYTSHLSLVLPGAGLSTSVNLSDIGQASSSSNSAYASSTLNPAVLYKNMVESYSVIERAANIVDVSPMAFGKPVVKLVDETSLIGIDVIGRSAEESQQRAEALLAALSGELDKLRADEAKRRESSATETVQEYQHSVERVRDQISALQTAGGLNSAEQYSGIVGASEVLRTHVAETEAALRRKEAEVNALATTLVVTPEIAALTMKAHADPEIGALANAVAKTAADLAELAKQLGPRHPKLLAARDRAEGDAKRLAERGVIVTGLDAKRFLREIELTPNGERAAMMSRLVASAAERDGMRAELRNQSIQLVALQSRVRDLVDTAARLDALNRDYKVADAVFSSALARINSTKSDLYASYPLLQVAEPASLPDRPSSPNKLIAALSGVAATLFLAIALGLAWVRQPLIKKILARPSDTRG